MGKVQWVVLTYLLAKELRGLRLSPSGVKEEWYQWPRWIGGYNYSNINANSLHIAVILIMKYVRDLDRLIR